MVAARWTPTEREHRMIGRGLHMHVEAGGADVSHHDFPLARPGAAGEERPSARVEWSPRGFERDGRRDIPHRDGAELAGRPLGQQLPDPWQLRTVAVRDEI